MNGLKFKLQVITPLFLSGADQQGAELRPPSIRGALRFWFRAMMGGVVGGDVEKVRKLEEGVWGTTDVASHLRVRICDQQLHIFDPTREKDYEKDRKGLIYLSFPYLEYEKETKSQRWNRPYIKPGSSFTVSIGLASDNVLSAIVEGTVWLLAHFGGLGARTRRGFGSLRVHPGRSDGLKPGFLSYQPAHEMDLVSYFRENLSTIQQVFAALARQRLGDQTFSQASGRPSIIPKYSSFADWCAVLLQEVEGSNWKDVLNLAGKELRAFREDPSPEARMKWGGQKTVDYMEVISDFYNGRLTAPSQLDYDVFGLPIQYQSSFRERAKVALQWRYQQDDKLQDRRASPLFIRPFKFEGCDKWCLAFYLFKSEFLPPDAVECLMPAKTWPSRIPKPEAINVQVPKSTGIIEKFLDHLKEKYKGARLLWPC